MANPFVTLCHFKAPTAAVGRTSRKAYNKLTSAPYIRRPNCSVSSSPVQKQAVQEWDVVEYRLPDDPNLIGLGVVQQVTADRLSVSRLYEESPGLWLIEDHSGATEQVSMSAIRSVVEADYGQRGVQDRVSNPHGEHAEEIWLLLQDIPEDVYRGCGAPH